MDDEEGAGLELETVTWMQGDWKKLESNESVNGAIAPATPHPNKVVYIVATRIRPRSMIFFPTCQVRVVRFYVSVACRTSTAIL